MKLLLTSEGLTTKAIRNAFYELFDNKSDISLGFIPTAADLEPTQDWVIEDIQELIDMGIHVQVIDLRTVEKMDLKSILGKLDGVWVNGGNTFYLLKWMRKSGFIEIIREILEKGKVYIGVSAGSIIAGPSIDICTWKNVDDTSGVLMDDLSALHLTDVSVFPHYSKNWENIVRENKNKLKNKLICVTDKQAVLVRGTKVEVI